MVSRDQICEYECEINVQDIDDKDLLVNGNGSLGSSLREFKSPLDFYSSPAMIASASLHKGGGSSHWAPARSSVS